MSAGESSGACWFPAAAGKTPAICRSTSGASDPPRSGPQPPPGRRRGGELLPGDRVRDQPAPLQRDAVEDPRHRHARLPALADDARPRAFKGRQARPLNGRPSLQSPDVAVEGDSRTELTRHPSLDERFDPGYRVVEHDPRWALLAATEIERVGAALGSVAVRIEHVGSTSVPGLAAKPIIDLQRPSPHWSRSTPSAARSRPSATRSSGTRSRRTTSSSHCRSSDPARTTCMSAARTATRRSATSRFVTTSARTPAPPVNMPT